jgi:hypothetical protein
MKVLEMQFRENEILLPQETNAYAKNKKQKKLEIKYEYILRLICYHIVCVCV